MAPARVGPAHTRLPLSVCSAMGLELSQFEGFTSIEGQPVIGRLDELH